MSVMSTQAPPRIPTDTFAARLAVVRQDMGWNVKEAARECGLGEASWRVWEIKKAMPRDAVGVVSAISQRTGISREWLMWGGPLLAASTSGSRNRSSSPYGPISGLRVEVATSDHRHLRIAA